MLSGFRRPDLFLAPEAGEDRAVDTGAAFHPPPLGDCDEAVRNRVGDGDRLDAECGEEHEAKRQRGRSAEAQDPDHRTMLPLHGHDSRCRAEDSARDHSGADDEQEGTAAHEGFAEEGEHPIAER